MLRSVGYYERAIERDPGFALAHVGIATVFTELGEIGALSRGEAGARAIAAAEQAVRLDPELGEAHCALAYVRWGYEFDWPRAETGFKRAIELSPGSADAYDLYGRMCAGLGRLDDAIALHRRAHDLDPLVCQSDLATSLLRAGHDEEALQVATQAITLDPHSSRPRATLGWALFRLGRVDEGLAELERAVALTPAETVWQAQLGQACALAGRTERAREILHQLEDPSRPTPASPYHLAYLHVGLGDAERAMDCLERAFEKGTGAIFGIKGSFLLAPLREHPRFIALLEKMHLA
jgi:serine/threonine-protein kinase